jgi:hypothetical protein
MSRVPVPCPDSFSRCLSNHKPDGAGASHNGRAFRGEAGFHDAPVAGSAAFRKWPVRVAAAGPVGRSEAARMAQQDPSDRVISESYRALGDDFDWRG